MVGYFKWLCEQAGIETDNGKTYYELAKTLYARDFVPLIDGDKNRAWDGRGLRGEWAEDDCEKYNRINQRHCSVFEMLLALAKRMNYLSYDDTEEDRTKLFFWIMVDNLGLLPYDDDHFYEKFGPDMVEMTVDKLLNREYEANGIDGLFPLKWPKSDQRRVEIWYQMNAWLIENEDIL